ncbi:MAG: hypothetical protein NVSMB51_07100 [Solirubrobacteraceae bacterium]
MDGAIALELARRGAVASVAAFSPAGFWTPAERRFCQRSLMLQATAPDAVRPLIRALLRSAAGRRALLAQLFHHPERLPAAEALSSVEDLWSSPAFAAAVRAFDGYDFAAGHELSEGPPVTIAWGRFDRLLLYGRQAPRARAQMPWARHVTLGAGHVPHYDDPGAVAGVIRASRS